MSSIKYTEDHEWIQIDGDTGTVGITDHAQKQLGDIVFVEAPEVGDSVTKGDEVGTIESVKAASEVYSPASGEVLETNEALADAPTLVNESPESNGWIYKVKISDPSELDDLMDMEAYAAFVADEN